MEICLEADPSITAERAGNMLIGRIVVDKPLNRPNLVGIAFTNEDLMMKAMASGPWSVMSHNLNLQQWKPSQSLQEIDFSHMEFWIQIHNLPLDMMTKENAEKIGKILGKLNKVEDIMDGSGMRRVFLRIRVAIDISKPLCNGFWVPRDGKEKLWASLSEEYRFGNWIKAAPMREEERAVPMLDEVVMIVTDCRAGKSWKSTECIVKQRVFNDLSEDEGDLVEQNLNTNRKGKEKVEGCRELDSEDSRKTNLRRSDKHVGRNKSQGVQIGERSSDVPVGESVGIEEDIFAGIVLGKEDHEVG
ncbi:hypothetical protein COLO4_15631 [Corchorus olitorius]|uniref:Uncharacterized protein n=1 Tax=Corchorus olitorius TaxID=93759 RepID=A0A1R3JM30_9ROSI|nr:hypothetical protein COLO4_15631 [Corchorus olitorius]